MLLSLAWFFLFSAGSKVAEAANGFEYVNPLIGTVNGGKGYQCPS
jgi:hypothetical protein